MLKVGGWLELKSNARFKELDFYLNLQYPVTIHPDPDGGFIAEIQEFPRCMTHGEALEEVFEAIEDALHGTLAYAAKRDGVSLNQYISSLLASKARGDIMKDKLSTSISKS